MALPNPKEESRLQKILKINQQRISPFGVAERDYQIKKAQEALNKKREQERMKKR